MNRNRMARACAALLCLAMAPAFAQMFSDVKQSAVDYSQTRYKAARNACASLTHYQGTDILKLESREVAASDGVPAFCDVQGIIRPEIAFQVALPANWNGRFLMFGNGGHAGESLDDPGRIAQRSATLKHAFAFAQTNAGHDARKEPEATFGLNNFQKLEDYAYRAVHLTALNAKRIANAYYGTPVEYAYWSSCSTGGRQGLMEAQRFWDDFNGVVAGAPVLDFGGKTISGMWNGKAQLEAPLPWGKLKILADSVYAKCDKVDGLVDGIIDDPRRCDFDPARDVPQCAAGVDDAGCLTAAQAGTVSKIYGGVVSQGKPYFPGFSPGSEAVAMSFMAPTPVSGWQGTLIGAEGKNSADTALSESTMKYLTFAVDDPDYDWRRFDFDKDLGAVDGLRALTDATNPDLSRFRKRGGKLLMYFGWADNLLPPMMGVNYYERAAAANQPNSEEFLRLFMVPGMSHCRGGVGPDSFDAVTALVNWVEKGKAPTSIEARKFESGKIVRTRPLCPYPQVARYSGKGSSDEAKNFRCAAPR